MMDIRKLPYNRQYPSPLKEFIKEGLIGVPRQKNRSTYSTIGVDITYILKEEGRYKWSINTLQANLSELLIALHGDLQRYEKKNPEAKFWGEVTYTRGGRKVYAGCHTGSLDIFLWGPDHEVAQYDLEKHLNAIIELKEMYPKEKFAVKKILVRVHGNLKG